MSTIAARAHSNATLAAPVRRPAQPRRAQASPLQRIGRIVGRRPGRTLLLLLFSAVAVAILVNAMLFQKARHPAPIVSAPSSNVPQRQVDRRQESPAATPSVTQPSASATASPTSAPLPPSRPNDLQGAREASAPRPPAPVTSIPRTTPVVAAPAPAPAPTRSAAARDPIADLINGTDFRPPAEIRGAGAKAAPRRTVEN
ncbi:MAG: hypothetical protein K2Z25_00280 [Beijerinckiaceae bacterium]|nr:hypothetical protein [Beijerinckiaceae bacterium]